MNVNDLVEDREGDKAEVREVHEDGYVTIEWDCRPGHPARMHESRLSNLSERVRELSAPEPQLSIMGRERALVDALTRGLQGMVGGPPPSKKTLEEVRRHNSSAQWPTRRGSAFEVQICDPDDGKPTGHIARVSIELDRFERQS